MRDLFRNRNFTLLWGGQVVSSLGDWVLFIARPYWVYQLTGSVAATGLTFVCQSVLPVALGPLAGVVADRRNRRRLMLASDLARAAAVLILLGVQGPRDVWLVYASTLLLSGASLFFEPARFALVPVLLGEDRRLVVSANSLAATSDSLLKVIGPSLGGAMYAFWGPYAVVVADAASFLVSALCVWWVRPPARGKEERAFSLREAGKLVAVGLRHLRENRPLLWVVGLQSVAMLGQGVVNAVVVVFARDVLGLDSRGFGLLATCQGLGQVAAGTLAFRLAGRVRPGLLMGLGLGGMGAALLVLVNVPRAWLAFALTALVGAFFILHVVASSSLMQLVTPDRLRGRVFAVASAAMSLSLAVGGGLASATGDALGPASLLNIAGALVLVAAGLALGGLGREKASFV